MDIILHEVKLMHVPMLQSWLRRFPRESCDYNVCNLLSWGSIYHNQYFAHKERLVLYNPQYGYVFFPVGEWMEPEELQDLLRQMQKVNPNASLILIPDEYLAAKPQMEDVFELNIDRDWADYVYETQQMVELSGKKLGKKKNLISQFRRAFPEYKVMPLSASRRQTILQFTQKWKREREVEGIYLNTELKAIQNTLDMWEHLPVDGIIICHQERIVAYSIFSPQTEDMATVHFEKFDPFKKGSAQVINWETARYLQGKYKWLNREQDIGLPGLRQAKTSYMPDRLVNFITAKIRA